MLTVIDVCYTPVVTTILYDLDKELPTIYHHVYKVIIMFM